MKKVPFDKLTDETPEDLIKAKSNHWKMDKELIEELAKADEDKASHMRFIADKIKDLPTEGDIDLNPNACMVAIQIVERPIDIIRKRCRNLPMDLGSEKFYVVAAHDLNYMVNSFDLILKMFKGKIEDELKNASNKTVSDKDQSTEKL